MKRNVENIERVITAIEEEIVASHEVGFNMDTWCINGGCGTSACIGGTAGMIIAYEDADDEGVRIDHMTAAKMSREISFKRLREWFGISDTELHSLFFGNTPRPDHDYAIEKVTKPMALAALNDIKRGKEFETWHEYAGDEA